MFGFSMGDKPKSKLICGYICKECSDTLHIDDLIKHIVTNHDPDWRGSFSEALDEYDRKVIFGRDQQ